MSIEEALNEIRSEKKWYWVPDGKGGVRASSSMMVMAQRIEDGRAKLQTIREFFQTFGYEVEMNMTVKKNPDVRKNLQK